MSWENKVYSKGKQISHYPHNLVISLVASNLFPVKKGSKMLDLGCGTGNNAKFMAENGFQVYGIDGSSTAIDYCIKEFKRLKLKGDFIKGDFIDLPYKDNFFDFVLDRESLYDNEYEVVKKVIGKVYKKLKVGGLFISFIHNSYIKGYRCSVGLKDIKIFYKDFKIKNIMRHSIYGLVGKNKDLELDEYIIIAKKYG